MPYPTTVNPFKVELSTFAPNRVSVTHNYRKVVRAASVHRWRLSVSYKDLSRAQSDELFAFLVAQGGQFGTFTLPTSIVGRSTPLGQYDSSKDIPVVDGAHSIGDTTIVTNAWRTGGTTYRYFRLFVVDTNTASNNVTIHELEILNRATKYPTSAMTADNAPSPLVASASSGANPYLAFDNVLTGGWVATSDVNEWIKIDLGSGNGIVPSAFKITPADASLTSPKNFRLEGSNTGAFSGEETVLYTGTNVTSGWVADTQREFPVTTGVQTNVMTKGAFVQFAGDNKLYMLTEDVDVDANGASTITIYPGLVAALSDNALLTIESCDMRVSLATDVQRLSLRVPVIGAYTLDFVEDLN